MRNRELQGSKNPASYYFYNATIIVQGEKIKINKGIDCNSTTAKKHQDQVKPKLVKQPY